MNDLELRPCTSCVDMEKNFLSNCQAENYKELEDNVLKSLQDRGANMSTTVNYFTLP